MSWTDLFKSKKADPDVRWFGKLPTYADYYSSKTDENWAVEFNDWVLKGFEIFRNRAVAVPNTPRTLPVCACVMRLPKSGMTVFASVMDYGGDMRGRPFPLCFYVGIPTESWPGPTSDRLGGASRVIRDLLSLRREVDRFINVPGHFETVFGHRTVDLNGVDGHTIDTSWEREARAISLSDWFERARGQLKIDDQLTWFRVATRWGDSIAGLESKAFEPTLRFPMASKISVDAQVAGWIRWLETRINLKRRNCSLILMDDGVDGSGRLSIVARELLPDDFLLLSTLSNTLPYVDDLSAAKADDSAYAGKPGDPLEGRLNPNGSWIDFVVSSASAT